VILAKVVGEVVSTVKFHTYEGQKLLQVRPMNLRGESVLHPFTAIDLVDAGTGDEVLVCLEGKSAMDALGLGDNPVDAVILAVVDEVRLIQDAGADSWTTV